MPWEELGKSKVSISTPIKNPIEIITSEIYPVLFGVKMSNERDFSKGYNEPPRPLGWLYYNPRTYDIYYASGSPDNMKFLCKWNYDVTWNGSSIPTNYRPFITKKGDIVFIWRGDLLGTALGLENVRQNPIVYPAGDYDNPVEVDLGEGLKPTSWLMNCGADYIYNQDVFLFAEYTRPSHLTANVWRVTEPVTNPANWSVVKSFTLSGDADIGMKHCHTINYDTYSGMVYMTTGDDDSAAKVFVSPDYGLTWNLVIEGQRKYARVLNFIFTKDKVYWANDDYSHGLYSVDRDVNGIPDFTNITTLYDLTGHPPTYVNCLIDEPFGILLLNRRDLTSNAETEPLQVLFWDIKTSTMHILLDIYPLAERVTNGIASSYGFRVESANFYQPRGEHITMVGFSNPANYMDILNNIGVEGAKSRINNLSMEVTKIGEEYSLKLKAIPIKW